MTWHEEKYSRVMQNIVFFYFLIFVGGVPLHVPTFFFLSSQNLRWSTKSTLTKTTTITTAATAAAAAAAAATIPP